MKKSSLKLFTGQIPFSGIAESYFVRTGRTSCQKRESSYSKYVKKNIDGQVRLYSTGGEFLAIYEWSAKRDSYKSSKDVSVKYAADKRLTAQTAREKELTKEKNEVY